MRNHLKACFLPLLWAALAFIPSGAFSTVYYSKDEAFELAFGEGATVESLPVFLTDEQAEKIEKLAQTKMEGRLYTFHVGKHGEEILGYVALESHTVRTQPEMLMVVLSPKGELVKAEILAFHEPPEYQPPARWFERLYRRPMEEMQFSRGVDAISGATLSTRAALDSVRKAMAIHKIAISEGNP